jgi:hypothetical protein
MDADIVIFRRFSDGDIIALFPCLPAECLNPWPCQSYMRIGQHGAADPDILHDTRPAHPAEYAPLKAELEQIGYRLIVHRRFPGDAYARRKASLSFSGAMAE